MHRVQVSSEPSNLSILDNSRRAYLTEDSNLAREFWKLRVEKESFPGCSNAFRKSFFFHLSDYNPMSLVIVRLKPLRDLNL